MTEEIIHRVQIPWQGARTALDLLQQTARGAYRPHPIGNRAVIDCSEPSDAEDLVKAIQGARIIRVG